MHMAHVTGFDRKMILFSNIAMRHNANSFLTSISCYASSPSSCTYESIVYNLCQASIPADRVEVKQCLYPTPDSLNIGADGCEGGCAEAIGWFAG